MFASKHCGSVARRQQDLELGFQASGLACQLNAIDAAGHDDIREQKIDPDSLLENLKGLFSVFRCEDVIAKIRNDLCCRCKHTLIVIDD